MEETEEKKEQFTIETREHAEQCAWAVCACAGGRMNTGTT